MIGSIVGLIAVLGFFWLMWSLSGGAEERQRHKMEKRQVKVDRKQAAELAGAIIVLEQVQREDDIQRFLRPETRQQIDTRVKTYRDRELNA